jgi:hypothetical protein
MKNLVAQASNQTPRKRRRRAHVAERVVLHPNAIPEPDRQLGQEQGDRQTAIGIDAEVSHGSGSSM